MTHMLIAFALFVCAALAQAAPGFSWAHDHWNSKDGILTYDKIEHACRGALITGGTVWFGADAMDALTISVSFSILWEIKDGFLNYRRYGRIIGGDGFSYKDITAELAGALIVIAIKQL